MNLRPAQETEEVERIIMKTMFPELEKLSGLSKFKVREAAVAIVDFYEDKN